jgi:SpoVK/Ycf46/Vps4 family AAA+-type ATPase
MIELGKVPILFDLNRWIDIFVKGSEGFSGAEVVSSCQEAIMLSIDQGLVGVSCENMTSVIQNVIPQVSASMLEYYNHLRITFERSN